MKKLLSFCMVAAMSVAMLTGCATNSPPPAQEVEAPAEEAPAAEEEAPPAEAAAPTDVSLKIWAPNNQIEPGTMDKMTAAFQEAHPEWNITFTTEIVEEDVVQAEILKDASAAGDVFFFPNDQMQQLIDAGALARLGGAAEELVKTSVPPTVADTVTTADDRVFAIPYTHNTYFMYYDKSLLSEDDIKTMEGILAKDTGDDVFNFMFDSAGGWKGAAYYYGAGLTIYGEDRASFAEGCNWNNPTGIAVTNWLIDFHNNPKTTFIEDNKPEDLFAQHRLGAHFDGPWNYNLFKEALGDDLGMAVIPTFNPDGTDYQLKGFYGSKAIGVSAQSQSMEQAVAFAAFLGDKDMQILRFQETAQIPTNIEAGADPVVQADPVASVVMREADVASVMQPTSAEFGSRFWTAATSLFTEMRSGDLNKDNVQEKMDTFVSQLAVQ